MQEFKNYCQQLFGNWLKGTLPFNQGLIENFQENYCPEPYLVLSGSFEEKNTVFFLTNNPGDGLPFQQRPNIVHGKVINPGLSYEKNAATLAKHYVATLKGAPKKRIEKMIEMGAAMGFKNIVQLETFPLHSATFGTRDKSRVIQESDVLNSPMNQYATLLRDLLKTNPAIALSVYSDEWMNFQAGLIGLDLQTSKKIVTNISDNKNESGKFLYSKQNGVFKGITAVKGSYTLPAGENFQKILEILQKQR